MLGFLYLGLESLEFSTQRSNGCHWLYAFFEFELFLGILSLDDQTDFFAHFGRDVEPDPAI